MAYVKTVWVDEVLAGAERFEIKDNAGAAPDAFADLAQCQIVLKTAVTTAGTALNATNLNNIETGLDAIHKGAARSVKGNPTATASAETTDIAASVDGQVLRRSGTTIAFGTVDTAGITDSAVTAAKIANRTRKIWMPARQESDVTQTYMQDGVPMPDGVTTYCHATIQVPDDFVAGTQPTLKPIFIETGTDASAAQMQLYATFLWSHSGQEAWSNVPTAPYDNMSFYHVTTAGSLKKMVYGTALTHSSFTPVAGDIIKATLRRVGAPVPSTLDTSLKTLWVLGFYFEYTADS